MNCRMCRGDRLYKFLDLGFTPPADQFRRRDQLREPDTYYPLEVYMCDDCGLAQLGFVASPEVLYRNDYPYESSVTRTGHVHWSDFAESVVRRFQIMGSDLVVDVGSNVGVLLGEFKKRGIRIRGVDPAANIVMIAHARGVDTICDFFNEEVAQQIILESGKASVITATNVFAHVDDVHSFMQCVDLVLDDKGVFIFEAPYFLNLIKKLEYDTIYHEHLSYISVKPLIGFFEKFQMEILDIEEKDIHGGSIRVFVGRKAKWPSSDAALRFLEREKDMQINSHEVLKNFSIAVKQNKKELVWLLQSLRQKGKKIVGISAPAKGMTLLNYCRIDADILEFVTEKSKLKIGRFTPGAHIPVVPDSRLLDEQPDYGLLLAWNFADEIMSNLEPFRRKGGKFIIPIPTPKIVE